MIATIRYIWASTDKDGRSGESSINSEIKLGNEYDFNQRHIYRLRNVDRRKKAIDIAKKLQKIENIGYSQARRYGLWDVCVANNWDVNKVVKTLDKKKVDTDCSQFYACIINLTYGKIKLSKYSITANLYQQTQNLSKHFKYLPYTKNATIKEADGINAPGHHVVLSITSGKSKL